MQADTTAFVTGASGGIGRQIAMTLAEHGSDVALAARSDGIYETADLIGNDARTVAVETDVTDEDSVEAAIEETVDELDGVDCLVNNAGIAGPTLPADHIEEADMWETLDVNLVGAWRCVKHAAPHLREGDRGSIVNIGSVGGKIPYPNRTPYAASKMGMIGFSRALAYEFGHEEVTVNTVVPGPVEGDRVERALESQLKLEEMGARILEYDEDDFALADYFTSKEEVAELVAYLASPHARHITGQELGIDAGIAPY